MPFTDPYDPRTHYAAGFGVTSGIAPSAEPQPVTWSASGTGDTPVAEAYDLLQNAATEHSKFIDRLEGVKDQFTNDGLQQQLSNFGGSQAGQVADAVDRFCDELNTKADADVAAALAGAAQPGDAAQELRNQRAIDRAERVLGRASDGEKQVKAAQLLADADTGTVGAVAAELASMGEEQSVIDTALVAKLPQVADAVERRRKAQQSSAVLRANAGMLRRSIQGGSRLRVGLVDPTAYDPDK